LLKIFKLILNYSIITLEVTKFNPCKQCQIILAQNVKSYIKSVNWTHYWIKAPNKRNPIKFLPKLEKKLHS